MTLKINLDNKIINNLDLTPATNEIAEGLQRGKIADWEQKLQFEIGYELDENDPRELSEVPEIRLWFVRLDAVYPWLPFLLDWKSGELARYAAMLVPHQFNRNEGIIYNPEALEIWVTSKTFTLADWLQKQNIPAKSRLKSMSQIFGYELDDAFFNLFI